MNNFVRKSPELNIMFEPISINEEKIAKFISSACGDEDKKLELFSGICRDDYEMSQMNSKLISSVCVDEDKILEPFSGMCLDDYEMSRMNNRLKAEVISLEEEYDEMVKQSKDFTHDFATPDNKYFVNAIEELRKRENSFYDHCKKNITEYFQPRIDQINDLVGKIPREVKAFSYNIYDTYEDDSFRFDTSSPGRNAILHELSKYYYELEKSIKLCKCVLEDEAAMRANNSWCLKSFHMQREIFIQETKSYLDAIDLGGILFSAEYNPAIAFRQQFDDEMEWASNAYHRFTKDQIRGLVLRDEKLKREPHLEITGDLRKLFPNSDQKAQKCREIILGFDEVLPAKCKNNRVQSKYYIWLMHLLGLNNNQTLFVNYFNETYTSNPNHKFKTVTYKAVNEYKNNNYFDKDIDIDPEYKEFKQKLTSLFHVFDPSKTQQVPHSA
ncbi:hypothetical protein SAMN05216455_101561 [Segatella bryantii]|uniref:hypothetical protein n=1 Tax=Segatella bryantii TaxID=77095 RepID=UPI00089B5E6C|nr:hypothetical protein [Segatella bryantii]SDZ85207.1 hypothetical protein SAMN05216455_101561 [Segatella bryantii]